MLTRLLSLIEEQAHGTSVNDLCRALNAQPDAVAGMLDLLVRKGRIIEIGAASGPCAACKLENDCRLLAARTKRYIPAKQVCSIPEANLHTR